jgi:protease YdgD
MKRLTQICAVLFSGLIATGAFAQNTGLARLTDRDDLLGWEAVGRIDMEDVGFCTGTLISPDLVLTAAHCVYHPVTSDPVEPSALLFRAGLRDGTTIAERHVLQIAAHPGFDPHASLSASNVEHDVALLRLESPITSTEANPFILHSGSTTGTRVSVVSYGKGREDALSRQRRCEIVGSYGALMTFDCNVTFGSSGAPVFSHSGNRGRILSIISGMTTVEGRKLAIGMVLPDVVNDLKRQLRSNPIRPKATVRMYSSDGNRGGTGAKFVKSKTP